MLLRVSQRSTGQPGRGVQYLNGRNTDDSWCAADDPFWHRQVEHLFFTVYLLLSDVNEAWSKFQNVFISTLNLLAPWKQVRIKQRTEIWMNKEILSLIRERNAAYKKMKKNMNDETLSRSYRALRNLVQRKVRKAKLEH